MAATEGAAVKVGAEVKVGAWVDGRAVGALVGAFEGG